MMGVGKRIEQAMVSAGKKPVDIARLLGITDSAVSQWFTKDTGPKSARLNDLASFLNTSVDYLLTGDDRPTLPVQHVLNESVQRGRPDIPVWASAEAGADGAIILVPDPIDWTHRSERLAGVKNPFAFYIVGDSMENALYHGDQVVINPALQPRIGREHVFIHDKGDGQYMALVKLLVRASSTMWHVRQTNPAKNLELPKSQWTKAYVIAEIRRGGL
jgi:phage repressor protein C with HTH and peptisase S24 domain